MHDQETFTTPQLSAYIDKQKRRGVANIKEFEIEKEKRYASTAAAFILTLIGLSLSAKKKVKRRYGNKYRYRSCA